MKVIKTILILVILPILAFTTAHKFYISYTTVEYKNESIQISMKIFIDDLQETINQTYQKNYELAITDKNKEIDTLINNYITNKFSIKIDDEKKPLKYLGKEYKNDVVYLYLELSNIKHINSIEIKNSMLIEFFEKQKNIVNLHINNTKKTFFLTAKKDKDLLKF